MTSFYQNLVVNHLGADCAPVEEWLYQYAIDHGHGEVFNRCDIVFQVCTEEEQLAIGSSLGWVDSTRERFPFPQVIFDDFVCAQDLANEWLSKDQSPIAS